MALSVFEIVQFIYLLLVFLVTYAAHPTISSVLVENFCSKTPRKILEKGGCTTIIHPRVPLETIL